MRLIRLPIFFIVLSLSIVAQSQMHSHHHHMASKGGFVMNENFENLPNGCEKISNEEKITVRANKS